MIKKFRIGFFGDNLWAHKTLKYLFLDKIIDIDFICGRFSKEDKVLKSIAQKKKIKFLRIKNINNKKFIHFIKKRNLDLLVSMSFDQIFGKNLLRIINHNIINCHAGKLPFYRGRSPLNWVLINGEKEFGITTHFVNEKIDCGNIIDQKVFKIKEKDDYKSILIKSYNECAKILYRSIKKIKSNNYNTIPQKKISKKSSYFGKRVSGDEIINLKSSSKKIKNFVRGLVHPGPIARIDVKNNQICVEKIKILNRKKEIKMNKKSLLYIENNKIYIKTVDKKILRIDKWHLKNKMNNKEKLKIL